ncbi:MAG: hypothetical protein WC848_05280 [Parcubacteria group bacterium]|jgi:hypothetical protein
MAVAKSTVKNRDCYVGQGQDRQRVDIDQSQVIGSGGEAVIIGVGGNKALKLYHQPTAARSEKLGYIFQKGLKFPETVFGPEAPVYRNKTDKGIIGFQMSLMPTGAEPLAMLMRQDFCTQYRVTNQMKAKIFCNMLMGLDGIHKAGNTTVGDLNDQNQHFDLHKLLIYWIDADSWQIGNNFPCSVGSDDYLTPELYGIDLAKQAMFKPEHDYYSFAVLLFRAIMMAHPFGSGFHRSHVSLFERAKHGLTILDKDVRFPKMANPPEIMTDDLINLLLAYLKRQRTDSFPIDALREYSELLVECSNCHIWYPATRSNCPGCATKTIMAAQMAAKVAGCVSRIILETPGAILHFQLVGDSIYCLADEAGTTVLYIQPPRGVIERKELFATTVGARYEFFEETLVVCPKPSEEEPKLFLLDVSGAKIKPITKSTTSKFGGSSAVFGCSSRRLYRIVSNKIMSGDLFGDHLAEREVIEAMPNQTWFVVGSNPELKKELLFGCYRMFDELKWFLVEGAPDGRTYDRHNVELSALLKAESLIDTSVRFSNDTVLVMRQTKLSGTKYVRVEQLEAKSGKVLSSYRQKVSDAKLYSSIHGKGYLGHSVLHATDDGIVMEIVADQSTSNLPGTENYVTGVSQLLRYQNGVLVISRDRILYLTPDSK